MRKEKKNILKTLERTQRESRIKDRESVFGVTQWIEHQPADQRVTGSTPSQGTGLGFGPGPQFGARKRQPADVSLTHPIFLSFSFSLPSPLSKIFQMTGNQIDFGLLTESRKTKEQCLQNSENKKFAT